MLPLLRRFSRNGDVAGKDLSVWLTLPADPNGITAAGSDAVRRMITAGTDLGGVNIMTMDYGGSKLPERIDV